MKGVALAKTPAMIKPNPKIARLVADVPERIHRLVRMKCLMRGIQVRHYILELLAKDGIT